MVKIVKNKLKKSVACVFSIMVLISVLLTAFPAFAKGQENYSAGKVSEIQYLLMSDLIYCDLTDYKGQRVGDYIEESDVMEKAKRSVYKNPTGETDAPAAVKKYIGDWLVDEIFTNDESGFYACAFKNVRDRQIVFSFRGTTDAVGKDGLNDAEFGLMSVEAPQIDDTLNLTEKYISSNDGYTFSATGHSLGGALASEFAQYYGWEAQTFNAAQMTGTLYYDNWKRFAKVYRGFDFWKTNDHINQHDYVVGTYEYGLSKNAVKHKNCNNWNKFFAHAVSHMMLINEKDGSITLSEKIGESSVKNNNYIQLINGNGSVVMGNSKSNFLSSPRLYTGQDVLYGGDGDDYIVSACSNDVLVGGKGNDILDGGNNNDTYVYYDGDAADTILDSGGHDTMLVYSDKKISFSEDENYIYVYLDDEAIAKLDKNCRLDSYSGKPENAKITDLYYTFTIKLIGSDASEKEIAVKSEKSSKIVPVKKIVYKGNSSLKIYDSEKDKVFLLDNKNSSYAGKNLSVYRFFDSDKNSFVNCIYTKDDALPLTADKDISEKQLAVTAIDINDTTREYLLQESFEFKDFSALNLSSTLPYAEKGNQHIDFTEIDYTDSVGLELKKHMLIAPENKSYTLDYSSVALGADVEWESSDESVADVKNGKVTVNAIGQATIIAKSDGCVDVCRVYVISGLYAAIIAVVAVLIIILLVFITVVIVKHFVKKKMRRKRKNQSMVGSV